MVTECKTSTSGNKHILTIFNHLTGWPEAFPIPEKSANNIVSTFINKYLPVHMCPRYILSNNGTEFKNNLMDHVLKQLGIKWIFSAPYHPQSNGKLEVFYKYLKPTLKKLCEKDPSNCNQYPNQVLLVIELRPTLLQQRCHLFWYMEGIQTYPYISSWNPCSDFGRPIFWNAEHENSQTHTSHC